jgi:multidrug efflux pump subunit AcrB
MWIVQLALKRPYTFVVMAILILVMGVVSILRTPTDIFPNINIPVVSIIWNYNGLVPKDMSDRIVSVTERNLTTVVDNVEHIESQSLYGIAVVKVFLQPNAAHHCLQRLKCPSYATGAFGERSVGAAAQ